MGSAHAARQRPPVKGAERLEHHVAGSDAALDARGGEVIELKLVAQHLQEARLFRLHVEIGRAILGNYRSLHARFHGITRLLCASRNFSSGPLLKNTISLPG